MKPYRKHSPEYRPFTPLEQALVDAGLMHVTGGGGPIGGLMNPHFEFTTDGTVRAGGDCGAFAMYRPLDPAQSGMAYCSRPPGHGGNHKGNVGANPRWPELEWAP